MTLPSPSYLQLNLSKAEFIWFGTRSNLSKLTQLDHLSLRVCCCSVSGSTVVCDLAILPDSELSMRQHNSRVTSNCNYHLRRLRQIHRYVSSETMMQLVTSLVMSHIDCCNSVMVGLQASSTLSPHQRVQNAAAWLILGLSRQSHITPALQQLYWLPVKFRIIFKVATLMHNMFHHCAPRTSVISSLSAPVILIVANYSRQQSDLPWSTTRVTQFGRRSFRSVHQTSGTIYLRTSDSLTPCSPSTCAKDPF